MSSASITVFRGMYGVMLAVGSLRFVAQGWIEPFFGEPSFFFKYPGLHWLPVAPPAVMTVLYVAMAGLSLAGIVYRPALAAFLLCFAYAQAADVANYLNHYYLVLLLGGLLLLIPTGRATLPRWCLTLLRFQVAVVYGYAALAKLNSDWLLEAQPLRLWLRARADLCSLFAEPWVAFAASWGAFLYDATIVGWLSWRRSRPYAFVAVLGFHSMTHLLFDIGLFPFIMTAAATLFFDPAWPRRRFGVANEAPVWRPQTALFVVYAAVQLLLPLRHYLYDGSVLWHEEGMRWSWKVMVREKSGSVTYHVRSKTTGREWQTSPHEHLTWRQASEMSGQPDLILQLAHHIGRSGDVEVRAEAWASLNGRQPELLLDPNVDLMQVQPSWQQAAWITRGPL